MNLAYWCVLIAGVMPAATVYIAKARRGFDNADPRGWLERQEGYRKRADYAHRNHFEAFPFFAAAVIIADLHHVPQPSMNALAISFILARLAFTGFYIFDRPTLRSLSFAVGYACVLGLFYLAARA